jgi:hypothetical protein
MSQQRHQRLVHQRSTPASIGRTKFQTPRQTEETMLRQAKPMLQRGMGFGGTTISSDGGNYRLETGTRESSLGKINLKISLQSLREIFPHFQTLIMPIQHIRL